MNVNNETPTSLVNYKARKKALQAFNNESVTATSLVKFQSLGRIAVIGGMEAMEFAPRLSEKLHPQVILTSGAEEPGVPVIAVGGRDIQIQGYLGAFKIHLGEKGKANAETVEADLILDLSGQPLLGMAMKPLGYFVSTTDEVQLLSIIDELFEMTGSFEKPLYTDYDPSICAHSRSGKTACTRCIDSCPAEAVVSLGDMIEVNSQLCQGGGVCATVCPSGALRYAYPQAKDLLKKIRIMLRTYVQEGGQDPILAFMAEDDGNAHQLPEQNNILSVSIEELASVGLETWLTALAYGARTVLLVDNGAMPEKVAEELHRQLDIAAEILSAINYAQDSIQLVKTEDMKHQQPVVMREIVPAYFSADSGKRQAAFFAIDHLYQQADKSRPMISLPSGTMFGTVSIDDQCTLCQSCVTVCPGKALHSGNGVPQVQFVEANCLQCGMCTRTCPENAITISPRFLFDREQRNQSRILHEEPPFECISCGKPFATASVIETMLVKLQYHSMFQSERARNRLRMCEDCRVVDVVQDADAMALQNEKSVH
ncbi:MAG: 4Fe-4S binding protein [gamma proteobacterium symbiont of Lucinoma myriamae]|nr:4Fe-4S binding protein [gamma proteobacterium symbiont of Lucinoma myriamae]